ncbi:MAG: D-alanine--D-alanine ligase [Candidatus Pacebacteria bacterium]|nr:D-alanine--D-alanine ligase [Candidatus Paceibacterota bacterium]NUQ57348.1 D-alanine--D-alanine ligase [Candidatus Paceibacter sp.]
MGKIIVGVLRGGPSSEHDVSLKTGASVLAALPEKYLARDVFISKDNHWHLDRKPTTADRVFNSVDVIFNALHGQYGEDGKVQMLMDAHGVPYTGSGAVASALGMSKTLAREAFKKAGLKIARAVIGDMKEETPESFAAKIFKTMPPPWVIKPAAAGSSVGVSVVRILNELAEAVRQAAQFDSKILAEEYIPGREATCGVLDGFRGQKHYALPVIEVAPPAKNKFFDYEAKYGGGTREICPAHFDLPTKRKLEQLAVLAHNAVGARHYSRSDFIVSKKGIYILEINTLPGLTGESLVPKAVEAVGSSQTELIDHLLKLALSSDL